MARQIFAENPIEGNKQDSAVQEQNDVEDVNHNIMNDEEATIITASEMEKLFHEWDVNGHNDLSINSSLADRIQQYLAYQEELDPLRTKLAQRIYKPYTVISNNSINLYVELLLNNKRVEYIKIYKFKDTYRLINVSDFKLLLLQLKNPYAAWILETDNNNEKVDLKSYVISNGGTFECDTSGFFNKLKVKL